MTNIIYFWRICIGSYFWKTTNVFKTDNLKNQYFSSQFFINRLQGPAKLRYFEFSRKLVCQFLKATKLLPEIKIWNLRGPKWTSYDGIPTKIRSFLICFGFFEGPILTKPTRVSSFGIDRVITRALRIFLTSRKHRESWKVGVAITVCRTLQKNRHLLDQKIIWNIFSYFNTTQLLKSVLETLLYPFAGNIEVLPKEDGISWHFQLDLLQTCLKHVFSMSRN